MLQNPRIVWRESFHYYYPWMREDMIQYEGDSDDEDLDEEADIDDEDGVLFGLDDDWNNIRHYAI